MLPPSLPATRHVWVGRVYERTWALQSLHTFMDRRSLPSGAEPGLPNAHDLASHCCIRVEPVLLLAKAFPS